MKRNLGRGPKPHIPIQTRRRSAIKWIANALRRFIAKVVAFGDGDLADGAFSDLSDRFLNERTGSTMQTDLSNASRLLGHGHHLLPFRDGQAQRFFDVDILAGSAGSYKLKGVPVVRGGDDDSVQIFLVDQLAKIMLEGGLAADFLLSRLQIWFIH